MRGQLECDTARLETLLEDLGGGKPMCVLVTQMAKLALNSWQRRQNSPVRRKAGNVLTGEFGK